MGHGNELPQVSKTHRQSQFALADDRTCRRMVWPGHDWVVPGSERVEGERERALLITRRL